MDWKNKKVLVTGAGGFIGSHLTEALVRRGARVNALVGQLYHLGSGHAFSGHEVVRALMTEAGLHADEASYREDANSGGGVPGQIADARLAADELGWVPTISFEESIRDLWKSYSSEQ